MIEGIIIAKTNAGKHGRRNQRTVAMSERAFATIGKVNYRNTCIRHKNEG
jgi:hypothetical protein